VLLYLIRHGKTDWNTEHRVMGDGPIPLNEMGREGVRVLARALGGEAIRIIYTSTVVRAVETTRILSDAWGAEVREEPRLNESPYERWVGKRYGELRSDRDFQLYLSNPTQSNFSRWEGVEGIQCRALEAIERIRGEVNGGKIAAVSHSDVIKPIVVHYLGMNLDDMHTLAIANASVTLIDLRKERPRVRYVNVIPNQWEMR